MRCSYTKKELADLFYQMTNVVVDSNNILFKQSLIVTPSNVGLVTSGINFRALQIVVLKNVYGTGNIHAVINNTTGLPINDVYAHINGTTANLGVCLGFTTFPVNCSAEIDIYTFK